MHQPGQGAGTRLALSLALLGTIGCGADVECSLSEPCPTGSFCEAGACVSECDPVAQQCTVGVCTRDGRCAREQPDPDAGVCAALVLDAEFGIPTVVLLVDQSGSMDDPYVGGTRWDVLRAALIDSTDGVVTRRQSSIRFGLTLYTNIGGSGTCPDLVTVDPALNNRDAIAAVYEPARPRADTPTGESIEAVTERLAALAAPGRKYIILATDGEPDTCAQPSPEEGQPESVAAAEAAFDAGISLFILSVGTGAISQQHLQDVANAGVGLEVGGSENATYWEAGDGAQLAAAFDAITGSLLGCDLTVNGAIEADAVSSGVIYLDGNRLLLDDPNGWEPIDASSFRLLGDACTRAKRAGDHTVTAEFGCEPGGPGLGTEGGGVIDPGCAAVSAPALAALLVGLLLRRRRRG